MNKHLSQLIEIADLDREISSFEPRIKEAKKELEALTKQEEAFLVEIEENKAVMKDLSLSVQKNENHLADLSNKLEDIARKVKLIKTEKESKSLSLEEELAKEQITFANEEIARLNNLIKSREEAIKKLENEVGGLQGEMQEVNQKVEGEVKKVKDEQEIVFAKKNELVSKMDQKIISFYEKIRKWAKDSAVVSVTRQACGGCFMRINDKVYSDIIRSDDIITCPHCGRILFNHEENA